MTNVHDEEQLLRRFHTNMLRAAQLNAERTARELTRPFDAPFSPETHEADARGIADIYRQRISYEKELYRRAPRLAAFWGIAPATCQDLKQTLAQYPDTAIIQYFVCEERLLIFLTMADGTRAAHTNIPKQQLAERVRHHRQLIEMSGGGYLSSQAALALADTQLRDTARQLYDNLLAPVETFLPTDVRLCIIPHGVLHYLPFNTLLAKDQRYIVEKRELLYSVSGSIFDWCHTQAVDRANRCVVSFANPALSASRDNLPMAEEHARNLAANYLNVQLFARAEATKEAFWECAPTAGVLALDLHNAYNKNSPLDTALRFAPGGRDNGALTVREIYLRGKGALPGRLVVTAVCEGNIGEDIGAGAEDDLTTLARAFHYAGFATVITSLWRVHDLSAWLLMEAFYDRLLRPTDDGRLAAGEALRSAQLQVAYLSGREILERCLQQRERACAEDPHGLRAAWIDLSAVAWVEARCGNLAAAKSAYRRARATFASAPDVYREILGIIDHDLQVLDRVQDSQLWSPDYDQLVFAHPYYWGAFVLLGCWNC